MCQLHFNCTSPGEVASYRANQLHNLQTFRSEYKKGKRQKRKIEEKQITEISVETSVVKVIFYIIYPQHLR